MLEATFVLKYKMANFSRLYLKHSCSRPHISNDNKQKTTIETMISKALE